MEPTKVTQPPIRRRRSQRIPLAVPLLVSSLDPKVEFAENCETVLVSSHGCRLRSPRSLQPGTALRLDILHTDRTASARVVHSEPADPTGKVWEIAVELEKAENFWGIQFPPEDWATAARAKETYTEAPAPSAPAAPKPPAAAPPSPAAAPPKKEEPARVPPTPSPAAARPQPRPAAVPGVAPTAQQFETILREKAKAVAADFENSYRQSLGDLLVRLRADLEEKTSKDWERLRNQTQKGLEELAGQIREQVGQEAERRRQESTDAETKLQSIRQLREEVEAQLRTVGDILQQQVAQERDQLVARGRQDLERLVEDVRQQIGREMGRSAEGAAALQAKLEEMQQTRDYNESLVRLVPQTVDQRVQEGVANTLERIQARIEEEFTAQSENQVEQLERRLLGLAEQVGSDLRQKLFEDFDRHERDLLDRINVRVEEVKALESGLRQHASQMSSQLAQESLELVAGLSAQFNEQAARRQEELSAKLEENTTKLNQRAETAVRNCGEQTWTSLNQRLHTEFDQRQQELRQALETARTESARLATDAEKLSTLVDAGLEQRLQQAVADTVGRAREHLEQAAEKARQDHLAAIQEELDRSLAPLVSRGEVTADELNNLLSTIQQEQTRLQQQTAEFRRESEQSQKLVHDALVEATGQIKGRIHLAIEMAQEPVERTAREARARLEEMAARKSTELAEQLEETHRRLGAFRTELESSVKSHLDARQDEAQARFQELAEQLEETRRRLGAFRSELEASVKSHLDARQDEALARFQEKAEKLARQSTTQLQATLNEALESVSRALREKFGSS